MSVWVKTHTWPSMTAQAPGTLSCPRIDPVVDGLCWLSHVDLGQTERSQSSTRCILTYTLHVRTLLRMRGKLKSSKVYSIQLNSSWLPLVQWHVDAKNRVFGRGAQRRGSGGRLREKTQPFLRVWTWDALLQTAGTELRHEARGNFHTVFSEWRIWRSIQKATELNKQILWNLEFWQEQDTIKCGSRLKWLDRGKL